MLHTTDIPLPSGASNGNAAVVTDDPDQFLLPLNGPHGRYPLDGKLPDDLLPGHQQKMPPGTAPRINQVRTDVPKKLEKTNFAEQSDGFEIPFNGNHIKIAVAGLPVEHAREITWLYEHGRDQQYDLATLAGKLRRSEGETYTRKDIFDVFNCTYAKSLDDFVDAIRVYHAVVEARESIKRPRFISTSLTRQIFEICDRARFYQRITPIYGDGQTGKSSGLEEYWRRDKLFTRYLRLPVAAPLRLTMEMLAKQCHIPSAGVTNGKLFTDVIRHFDSRTMLIVDELQQITLAASDSDRLKTVEFLREIYDRSYCAMILCGTNEAMNELESGPNALWMRQLRRRSLPKVMLPSVADDEDIAEFAAYFGLGEQMPPEIVKKTRQVAADHGIGLLITYFQGAARMAAAERKPASWTHFQRTIKALANQGEKPGRLKKEATR